MSVKKEELNKLSDKKMHEGLNIYPRWRVGGKGQILPYYDADQCREILDSTCGVGEWSSEFRALNGKIYCAIGIDIESSGIVYQMDVGGARHSYDTSLKPVEIETFKAKTEATSAFVRAAGSWGIGRHLKLLPEVKLEMDGKFPKSLDGKMTLKTPDQLSNYCNKITTGVGWLNTIYRTYRNLFETNDIALQKLTELKQILQNED